jgi:hypothetical protein
MATITGVTRDSSGDILGSCVVKAFVTSTDVLADSTTSDSVTGEYSLTVSAGVEHYLVAYKSGSPDVSGTSQNDVIGS